MSPSDDPRTFYLTWRPTAGGQRLEAWMDVFRRRLAIAFGEPTIYDSQEPTGDIATLRDRKVDLTDVVSFATFDYIESCVKQCDHELRDLASRDPTGRMIRLWAVRMDAASLEEIWRRFDARHPNPWGTTSRWHLLPQDAPRPLKVTQADIEDAHEQIHDCCIAPMQHHATSCPVCLGCAAAPPAASEPPGPGLFARVRHMFDR